MCIYIYRRARVYEGKARKGCDGQGPRHKIEVIDKAHSTPDHPGRYR